MKKLTTGLFTVLLGLVAADGAYASIASDAWVNQRIGEAEAVLRTDVDKNTAAIETKQDKLTQANAAGTNITIGADGKIAVSTEFANTVAGKADKATTLDGYGIKDAYTKGEVDTELGKKQNKLTAGSGIKIDDTTNTITTDGIASSDALDTLSGKVDSNTGAIATLNGEGAGSVKKQISDAIANKADKSTTYSKTEVDTALAGKQDHNLGAANANMAVVTDANGNIVSGAITSEMITDGTITKADLDTGVQASLDKADNSLQKGTDLGTNIVNSLTDAQQKAVNSGITTELVTKYNGYETTISANTAAAETAQKTANAAIPKPTGECENAANKCVLTYNNSAYEWEVIERATPANP